MRTLKLAGMVAALLWVWLPAFADDVITNLMSPVVSYQYPENFITTLTNRSILSPIASYQYYEWPGNGVLNLQVSPVASYYYTVLPFDVPAMLQLQAGSSQVTLSWPVSSGNFTLLTTTNLADPNSWVAVTNVPAVGLAQSTITNLPTGSLGFFRLIPSQ